MAKQVKNPNKKGKNKKMARQKTYVCIVLDQSSSMASTKEQAIQNYNEQIDQQKLNSKDQDIFSSLITFNESVFEHHWCVPASELKTATNEDYVPGGMTAMRDAVGYAIRKLQQTVKPDENTSFLVVVISDGMENASKHFSIPQLRELVDSAQKTKDWTISYMGCSEDYLKEVSRQTGVAVANMAAFTNKNSRMYNFASAQQTNKLDDYYKARVGGMKCTRNLYSNDDAVCADWSKEEDVHPNLANPYVPPVADNVVQSSTSDVDKVVQSSTSDGGVNPFQNNQPVTW